MALPELKQFGDLVAADFERHPVWVACHVADYDEPWYDDTDEETFRPWSGALPTDPTGMLLVRAEATLNNGTRLDGFLTPIEGEADLSNMQPHLFVAEQLVAFWWGVLEIPDSIRTAFSSTLGLDDDAVFPIRFTSDQAPATGTAEITVWTWGSTATAPTPASPTRKRWFKRRS